MSIHNLQHGQKAFIRHSKEGWIGQIELTDSGEGVDVWSSHRMVFKTHRTYFITQHAYHPQTGEFVEDPDLTSLDDLEVLDIWVYQRAKEQAESLYESNKALVAKKSGDYHG